MDLWIKQGPVFDPQDRKGRRKEGKEGGKGKGKRKGLTLGLAVLLIMN